MGRIIAVSGKGGVGKTLVSALLVKYLVESGKNGILAIDADPDSNLAESLGVEFRKTIGDLREEINELKNAVGIEKKKYLDAKAFEITIETEKFDLIVMGRPEGQGCYCAINHMLREIIDQTTKSYNYTVIDAEAGLEHLSRRTTQNVDIMLVVTDASKKGLQTAKRIKELANELEIEFERIYLILNRVKKENREKILEDAKTTGIEIIGEIPEDNEVLNYDLNGIPLINLPKESNVCREITRIGGKIIND